VLAPVALHAQLPKIFVASFGNDANDGSRGSPKRNFQAAHDAVAAGGDIVVLDTAGYGALSITKSVDVVVPPGVNGFVSVSSGTAGVTVGTGLRVTLRGLIIEATVAGIPAGISVDRVSSLQVENCTITGFGTGGGSVINTGGIVINTSTVVGSVVVSDTVISDCPGSGLTHGDFGSPTNSTLVLERCRLLSNGQGFFAASSGRATVRNCIVSNNTGIGIRCGGVAASDVKVNVESCAVTDNGTGIANFSVGNVVVSNTAITGNTTGVTGNPLTYGNNQLINNTTDGPMGAVQTAK
jgi:parallel beta-helix repeat protein